MKIEVGDFVMTNSEFFEREKGIVIKKHSRRRKGESPDGTYYCSESVTVYWVDLCSKSIVEMSYVEKVN
tara:strand:- start:422 stop:628 length:207 start_codon:yes stop_codon:yes gene_type:complete